MAGADQGNLILRCIAVTGADNVIRDGWIVGFEEIERVARFGEAIFVFGCEFQDTNDHFVCVLKLRVGHRRPSLLFSILLS